VADATGSDESQTSVLVQSVTGFQATTSECIHILHDQNHWITTASLGGEVFYMDSLRDSVSPYVATQMMQLYGRQRETDGKLKVKILSCDKQTNAHDCGLYAAAFAFSLALNGLHNVHNRYVVASMRPHLEACLTHKEIRDFPGRPIRKGSQIPHKVQYIS